jgi:leader peptidase (prepilin peptidase)/N-methyltransferase
MHWFWVAFLLAFGACVGSFLNVVIYRLPRGQSVLFPARSFCPSCGRSIRARDNVPLVSWFALRGRCRDCRAPISPRYVLIEAATALLAVGLYLGYFVVGVRDGAGTFAAAWPTYLAHFALLSGLLACSLVDVKFFIIPVEVMWVCAAAGLAAAVFRPHPFILEAAVGPTGVAAGAAALVGLLISAALVRCGLLQPSFLDAEPPKPPPASAMPTGRQAAGRPDDADRKRRRKKRRKRPKGAVGVTSADGVDPRKEMLRELLYLAPAVLLAAGAAALLGAVEPARRWWAELFDPAAHRLLAPRLLAGGASVYGYLIGGLWVWGTRIAGTVAFGREAMGMGDVHLLAAVGAVAGWIVPSVAFFVAPFLGLLWAVSLWAFRRQRELPYGPWLAAATGTVMIFYDAFIERLRPFAQTFHLLSSR